MLSIIFTNLTQKLAHKTEILYNIRGMFRKELQNMPVYTPGKPIEEVMTEYNLCREDVIKLGSNENPLGASAHALAAIKDNLENIRLYPESDSIELREVLAHHLRIKANELIIGRGSDEVIQMLSKALLNENDEIVVADPTFSVYEIAATIMGATCVKVPLKEDFTHNLQAMADKISERTKIIYLTNPHNPTGSLNSSAEIKEFVASVPENVIIALDEAYAEYVERSDYISALGFFDLGYKNVFGLRTFSKIYGIAGLRVGYGFSNNPELMAALYKVKEPFNVSNLGQIAAAASILDTEHVKRSQLVNNEGKAYLMGEIAKIGLTPYKSEANFILVNTFRDIKTLTKALLKRGIIVRDCTSFGLNSCFRVTIGTYTQNAKVIATLTDAIAHGEW